MREMSRADLLEASDHALGCVCDLCLSWWASMKPEDPDSEENPYPSAPFSAEQIRARWFIMGGSLGDE